MAASPSSSIGVRMMGIMVKRDNPEHITTSFCRCPHLSVRRADGIWSTLLKKAGSAARRPIWPLLAPIARAQRARKGPIRFSLALASMPSMTLMRIARFISAWLRIGACSPICFHLTHFLVNHLHSIMPRGTNKVLLLAAAFQKPLPVLIHLLLDAFQQLAVVSPEQVLKASLLLHPVGYRQGLFRLKGQFPLALFHFI